jgi:hypothetical protein
MNGALLALLLYLGWTLVTYLLEGNLRTLLRPEAMRDRLPYAFVANVAVGVVVTALLLGKLVRWEIITPAQIGLRSPRHTLGCGSAAMVLGAAVYLLLRPASLQPVVVGNAFAQVLNVSIAEVLVCWAAVGPLLEAPLRRRQPSLSVVTAMLVCSTLFGVYHFAHSPPFNSPRTVFFLSAVGLFTSVFYSITREVYATIIFHNCLGVAGVTQALAGAGRVSSLQTPLPVLYVTAALGVAVLVALDVLWVRRRARGGRGFTETRAAGAARWR